LLVLLTSSFLFHQSFFNLTNCKLYLE
jgi:hypothetical protein